jgi:hypothetical protein
MSPNTTFSSSAKNRTWTKPEIVSKAATRDAQYGGNTNFIDHLPASDPFGNQLAS